MPLHACLLASTPASSMLNGNPMLPIPSTPHIETSRITCFSSPLYAVLSKKGYNKTYKSLLFSQQKFPAVLIKYADARWHSKCSTKPLDSFIEDIMDGSSDEEIDLEDDNETQKQPMFSSVRKNSANHSTSPASTFSSPNSTLPSSTINEIVALFMKAKSKQKEVSQERKPAISDQTSDPTSKVAADSILEVLQKFSNHGPPQPKRQGRSTVRSVRKYQNPRANHRAPENRSSTAEERVSSQYEDPVVSSSISDVEEVADVSNQEDSIDSDTESEFSETSNDTPNLLANVSIAINESTPDQNVSSSLEQGNLKDLKLSEMRAIAKSYGLKGYSRLNKSELLDLLMKSTDN